MFYGTNFGVGKFIYQCVIPVTLGNIVGGSFLTGATLWFLYGRDDDLATNTGQPLSGEKKGRRGVVNQDRESGETVTAGESSSAGRGDDMV